MELVAFLLCIGALYLIYRLMTCPLVWLLLWIALFVVIVRSLPETDRSFVVGVSLTVAMVVFLVGSRYVQDPPDPPKRAGGVDPCRPPWLRGRS